MTYKPSPKPDFDKPTHIKYDSRKLTFGAMILLERLKIGFMYLI